jgi:hypothetical protein
MARLTEYREDERLVNTSYEGIMQRTLGSIDDLRSRQVMR